MMKGIRVWVVGVIFCIALLGCTKKDKSPVKAEQASKNSQLEKTASQPEAAVATPEVPAEPYKVLPNVGAAGTVEGQIKFAGTAPTNKPIAIPQSFRDARPDDFAFCESKNVKQDKTQILAGGVANVVVEIKGVAAGKAHLPPTALSVEHCRLSPRISLLPIGSRLTVSNADPFVFASSMLGAGDKVVWAQEIMPDTKLSSMDLKTPEKLVVSSAQRPWMKAFVRVVPHPYFAVSALAGRFKIENIPVGKYAVTAWHEVFGLRDGSVEITEGGTAKLELIYVQ